MNQWKKLAGIALALALLAGCTVRLGPINGEGHPQQEQPESILSQIEAETPEPQYELPPENEFIGYDGELRPLNDFYTLGKNANETGLYDLLPWHGDTCLLLYTDFAAHTQSPLCDVEGCDHMAEGCPARFPFSYGDVYCLRDGLLLLQGYNRTTQISTLYALPAQGGDGWLLLRTSANRWPGSLLEGERWLWISVTDNIHVGAGDNAGVVSETRYMRVDKQTGRTEDVPLPEGWQLFGAWGESLILTSGGWPKVAYAVYDLSTGEQENLNLDDWQVISRQGDCIYGYGPNWETDFVLLEHNLATGQKRRVWQAEDGILNITAFRKGVIFGTFMDYAANYKETPVWLDIATGEVTPAHYSPFYSAKSMDVILAEYEDVYIVSMGMRRYAYASEELYNENGLGTGWQNLYGAIPKEAFWQHEDAYTMFTRFEI